MGISASVPPDASYSTRGMESLGDQETRGPKTVRTAFAREVAFESFDLFLSSLGFRNGIPADFDPGSFNGEDGDPWPDGLTAMHMDVENDGSPTPIKYDWVIMSLGLPSQVGGVSINGDFIRGGMMILRSTHNGDTFDVETTISGIADDGMGGVNHSYIKVAGSSIEVVGLDNLTLEALTVTSINGVPYVPSSGGFTVLENPLYDFNNDGTTAALRLGVGDFGFGSGLEVDTNNNGLIIKTADPLGIDASGFLSLRYNYPFYIDGGGLLSFDGTTWENVVTSVVQQNGLDLTAGNLSMSKKWGWQSQRDIDFRSIASMTIVDGTYLNTDPTPIGTEYKKWEKFRSSAENAPMTVGGGSGLIIQPSAGTDFNATATAPVIRTNIGHGNDPTGAEVADGQPFRVWLMYVISSLTSAGNFFFYAGISNSSGSQGSGSQRAMAKVKSYVYGGSWVSETGLVRGDGAGGNELITSYYGTATPGVLNDIICLSFPLGINGPCELYVAINPGAGTFGDSKSMVKQTTMDAPAEVADKGINGQFAVAMQLAAACDTNAGWQVEVKKMRFEVLPA